MWKKVYERVALRNMNDRKEFWETIPVCQEWNFYENRTLVEQGKIISDDSKFANSFSNLLENAAQV